MTTTQVTPIVKQHQWMCSLSLLLILHLFRFAESFAILQKKFATISPRRINDDGTSTALYMSSVFDFLKERSKEGIAQLDKLSAAAKRGELQKGLREAATYTQQTNQAFAIGLAKSRNQLLQNIEAIVTGVSPDQALEELQDVLVQADLGTQTAEDIVVEIKSLRADSTKMISNNDLKSILRGKLLEALETTTTENTEIQFSNDDNLPTVLFIIGANGMGKTTTIGKLAYRLQTELNQTVLMAACDTFRAGAVDQLQQWANRVNCDMIGPDDAAKTPAAVLYKALDTALKPKSITFEEADADGAIQTTTITKPYSYDVVLVDTSGRLSNNEALTAELVKMKKVIQKRFSIRNDDDGKPMPNADVPHETLLVLDASQGGRMALQSARIWNNEIGLSGLILTKLDGTARGGSVVAISRDLQLPVKLVGVGEKVTDLQDFDRERFVDGLLGIGAAGGKAGSSTSSKDEGIKLAARLQEMRKERDARAKVIVQQKKDTTKAVKQQLQESVMAGVQSLSGDTSGVVSLTDGGGNTRPSYQKPNRRKNASSNKKRKKK